MRSMPRPPLVDVVVPVYDEEADLEASIRRLRGFLDRDFPFETRVTIADDVTVLVIANVIATAVRSVVLQRCIARPVPATLS